MAGSVRRCGFALPLLAVLGAGCSSSGPGQEVSFSLPVTVREVETGTVEDRVIATGTLRVTEVVALRAETSGTLGISVNADGRRFAEGDPVETGQPIAEITGEEVRLAARTEATRQRYESALRDRDSRRQLYDEGLISELELRPAEDALAEAKLELDRSHLTESRSLLVTPISGVVLELARDEQGVPLADGQLVAQGAVLARVAPTARMIADVSLVGPDIARVRPKMAARVRHHAFDDETFSGRVVRLAPAIDVTSRSLRAEVEVENRRGMLRPGMFVEVTLVTDRRQNVPVVPRRAVTERGGRKVAFVLRGQRVQRRELVLGYGDDETVEVREGLEPGERIVVKGLETLSDETRVRVTGS